MSTTEQQEAEAQQAQSTEPQVPPAGEEIHLPGPSALPLVTAVGITLAVIGTTIDWKIWSSMGVLITVISIVLWVRSTREDVAHLPEEHHQH